jgi:hypothetical protein
VGRDNGRSSKDSLADTEDGGVSACADVGMRYCCAATGSGSRRFGFSCSGSELSKDMRFDRFGASFEAAGVGAGLGAAGGSCGC